MVEFKVVMSTKDGKSYQKDVKSPEADELLKRRIGEKFSGDSIGYAGYEFEVTGGSDKCGFPMRSGIQFARKMIKTEKGVGFSGLDRNDKKQRGLIKKRTVCGEMITKIITQINLKVLKEGAEKLAPPETAEAPKEVKVE